MVTEETDREDVQIIIPTKPIDPEVQRTGLKNRKKLGCKEVVYPKVNKLIQLHIKPHNPEHVGEVLNRKIRSQWIDCLYICFDKIHNSGTLSCPFP